MDGRHHERLTTPLPPQLSGSHSSCVVVQAVAALLNLAISADLREEMGRRGVVEKMLGEREGRWADRVRGREGGRSSAVCYCV